MNPKKTHIMKKTTIHLILIGFIALMSHPVTTAQNDLVSVTTEKKFAIGINFGRMVSDFWFIGEDYSDLVPVKSRTSYTWGISFDIQFSDKILFNTGIMYKELGRAFDPDFYENPNYAILVYHNTPFQLNHLDYLVVSQSLLLSTKGKWAVYAGPGLYQAFLVTYTECCTWIPPLPQPHKFDLGLGLTAGIRFLLHPSIQANIEMNASSGVRPIFSRTKRRMHFHGDDQKTIFLNKTLSGNITLSYRF